MPPSAKLPLCRPPSPAVAPATAPAPTKTRPPVESALRRAGATTLIDNTGLRMYGSTVAASRARQISRKAGRKSLARKDLGMGGSSPARPPGPH